LRIEVRLAKKVKMNAMLKQLGFPTDPTFKDVFKKNVCQKILLTYWSEIITSKNLFLFDTENNPKKTLVNVFKSKKKITPKEAFYLVGLRVLSREGIRDVRAVVEQFARPLGRGIGSQRI
jgi:hypothetical protein